MTNRKPRHTYLADDPEFAFQIPGWEQYGVTQDGRVRRLDTGKWLTPCVSCRGGYLTVALWVRGKGHTKYVHQLVAETFYGPRPSPSYDTAHSDGNKMHNHFRNIRWATRAENEADKLLHGRSNRGERNGSAKVTDQQADEIRALSETLCRSTGGVKFKKGELGKLAAKYGITKSAVYQIISGMRRAA